MREGEPSRTAQHVAAYRLGFERLPAPFGAPEASDRLEEDVAAGADIEPGTRLAGYLRARTSFFDRAVLSGLQRGGTQVATIGAGYDGRALRYAKPGVRWFEVDHPATQRDKRQRLARLALTTPNITFVAADMVADDVAAALTSAGFEPDAPSLVLCEGVAVYLEPAVLAGLLAQLRSVATAGTRLAMSAGIPAADPARRERFAARVAELGEPVALAGADVETLLRTARWRTVELSERAQRVGMVVGAPVWEPGTPPTVARVGAYLEQTFHRDGMDTLAEHLAATYGVAITGLRRLDAGVVRVDRADGPDWAARIFPAARPLPITRGDAEILSYLADVGYPAERLAHPEPVSDHEGQAVMVTELVPGKAPRGTQATFRQLGELLGRLHTLPDPPRRPGGAWHHLAFEGGPDAEIAALGELVDARSHVPDEWRPALAALRHEVEQLDDLHDLPLGFTHPDFVTANAIVPAAGGLTMIDWSGAGVAPRLWTLAFLLWSAGLSGPRHVEAVVNGYRLHVQPDLTELDRLEGAVAARPRIFDAWGYATGRRKLTEVDGDRRQVMTTAHEIAGRARSAFRRT
ncbi:MAG: SAM-dependent methyltransferase [Actinomycetota bacterium]|nr:SAM-dependent methyltransferase [Actinomycetota bacterium]